MEKLSRKNTMIIGLTLFSMFFGAGNLIFPPFLGEQAGGFAWIAFGGFALSAIGLPVLGVAAVARSGGLNALAGRVHPRFAAVFTFLIYLSIGPCLAIPRTASTSFEMALVPFLPETSPLWLFQLIYSVIFFAVALMMALTPDKLSERLGKRLTPCLLILIAVVFIGCLVTPFNGTPAIAEGYRSLPFVQGFLDGYQTMDTIAALNFGIIIALNIGALGIRSEKGTVRETIKAGWIAGGLLLIIYAALTYIGVVAGGAFGVSENGAQTLTQMVLHLFGRPGLIILALIFLIACLNTCTGLISCCSDYFHGILPRFSYKQWACFFAFVSMIIANAGLNAILAFSVPVLSFLYPLSIVLITLSFLQKHLEKRPKVYPIAILFTGIISLLAACDQAGLLPASITTALSAIPFYTMGLGWVLPAIIGSVIGFLIPTKA